MKVYHPALGLPKPTVTEMLDRCDDEARHVIALASALAARRQHEEADLLERIDQHQATPYNGPRWVAERAPRGLNATDLRRALLALHADDVTQRAFRHTGVSESFHRAVSRWRGVAQEVDEGDVEALEARWGRRWALAIDQDSNLAIDLELLTSTAFVTFADDVLRFNPDYHEGIITVGEAVTKMHVQLLDTGARTVPPLRPAYFDGSGIVDTLDYALNKGFGAAIVGGRQTGRSHLLSVFREQESLRHRRGEDQTDWSWWHFRSHDTSQPIPWAQLEQGDDAHSIVVSTDGMDTGNPPTWGFGGGRMRSLDELVALARKHPDRIRVVVLLNPAEYDAWYKRSPEFHKLTRHDVGLCRRDSIPIWLCHLYAQDDWKAARVTLGDLFAVWKDQIESGEGQIEPGEDIVTIDEVTGMAMKRRPVPVALRFCQAESLHEVLETMRPGTRRGWQTALRIFRGVVRKGGHRREGRPVGSRRWNTFLDALEEPERIFDLWELYETLRVP